MTKEKHWRDAKMPQWVKESIDADMAAMRLHSALSWPTEGRPVPAFCIGDYDRDYGGTRSTGVWWVAQHRTVTQVTLRDLTTDERKRLVFVSGGLVAEKDGKATSSKTRGSYFATEREAHLAVLWDACTKAAGELAVFKARVE